MPRTYISVAAVDASETATARPAAWQDRAELLPAQQRRVV
jgi:hypothetical protein